MKWNESGTTESTQWVLLMPVLMLLVLGIIQSGLWLHGWTVLGTAASAAAEAASVPGASPEVGSPASAIAARAGLVDFRERYSRVSGGFEVTVAARVPVFWDVGQGEIVVRRFVPSERLTRP